MERRVSRLTGAIEWESDNPAGYYWFLSVIHLSTEGKLGGFRNTLDLVARCIRRLMLYEGSYGDPGELLGCWSDGSSWR